MAHGQNIYDFFRPGMTWTLCPASRLVVSAMSSHFSLASPFECYESTVIVSSRVLTEEDDNLTDNMTRSSPSPHFVATTT
jgi:hypothetical protein